MASITCSKRLTRVALVVLGIVVASCANPTGRALDGNAERPSDVGSAVFEVEMALADVAPEVEPAWAAADPARDLPAPAPRDWLKNLVGQGARTDPGAPSP
jgi:hypothetical protein